MNRIDWLRIATHLGIVVIGIGFWIAVIATVLHVSAHSPLSATCSPRPASHP